jgi:hypothetical protein
VVFTGGAGIYANNGAASNNPTELVFWTTSAGSPAARLTIASTGAATFSSSVTAGTGQGFMNLTYQAGYNRIWSFGSGAEAYGMGYYQGVTAPGGSDCMGFHFGNTATPLFYVNNSGAATFSSSVTAASLSVSGVSTFGSTLVSNSIAALQLRNSNSVRWELDRDGTEIGSNSGSNFQLYRYDDSGNFLGTSLGITRSTGAVSVGGALTGTSATFSSSVEATSFIKTSGTSAQYLMADGSTSTTSNVAPRYVQTINVSQTAYTQICTIVGGSLASAVNMSFQGTSSSVVVNVTAQILVNHYQDISITTTSGFYSQLNLRVISNNNETYSVEAQVISGVGTTTNLNVEVFPLNSETVTFGGSPTTPGTTLVHTTRQGLYISASEGISISSSNDIYAAGNVGIGTTAPAGKLSVEGDGTEYSNIVFKQSSAQQHLILNLQLHQRL